MDEHALFKFTQGLYVLGGKDAANARFAGSIVDAVMQVANKPLVIALSCTNTSYTKECIDREGEFSLSVLSKTVDPKVISNFGFQSSRNVDKWSNVDYCVKDGLPYLNDNIATVRATIKQKIIFESNTLFIAELCDCVDTKPGEPLTYGDYRSYFKDEVLKTMGQKAEPKKEEPQKEEPKAPVAKSEHKTKVCNVCGYVYDGDVPFEELPDDWACPVCGVDKTNFS